MERRRLLPLLCVWLEVELDIARDVRALACRSERAEALRIRFALRRNDDAVRERFAEQCSEPAVGAEGARRDACAREHEGHALAAAFVEQVGPQLRLDDHDEARA